MSRFGKIDIAKTNPWSAHINGYGITPYMQDMMLYAGQDDNYLAGQQQIEKYLGGHADDSQIKNLVSTYGSQLETEMDSLAEVVESQAVALASKVQAEA